MKKFKVEKLVRDNILDSILKNKLNKVSYKVLNKKKFLEALKKKFFEELEELDFKDTDRSIKELADLQLIIDTCLKVLKVNKSYFRKIADNKNKKVGKFDKKVYINTVDLDNDDEWIPYYESKFEKIK